MRKTAALVLLIFLSVVGTVTANTASPTEPAVKKSEKEKPYGAFSAQASKPLPTVIPTPEYRKLPAYDFVPKSKREVSV